MAWSRTSALALGTALGLAATLAGCETSDRDRDGRNATVDAGGRTYELRATGDRGEYRGEDGDVRLEVDRSRAELRIKDESDYQNCEER